MNGKWMNGTVALGSSTKGLFTDQVLCNWNAFQKLIRVNIKKFKTFAVYCAVGCSKFLTIGNIPYFNTVNVAPVNVSTNFAHKSENKRRFFRTNHPYIFWQTIQTQSFFRLYNLLTILFQKMDASYSNMTCASPRQIMAVITKISTFQWDIDNETVHK